MLAPLLVQNPLSLDLPYRRLLVASGKEDGFGLLLPWSLLGTSGPVLLGSLFSLILRLAIVVVAMRAVVAGGWLLLTAEEG